jgi:subtilisin family serine protease
VQAQEGAQPQEVTGEPADVSVLVRFRPEIDEATRQTTIAQMGGELVVWMPQIHVAEVRLPDQGVVGVAAAAVPFSGSDQVIFAEVDLPVTGAYQPSDPDFAVADRAYGYEQIDAYTAWDTTLGSESVVIAVVDSGVKLDHPAFAGRLTPGYDFVNNDALPDDDAGHGTHTAGIIAAAVDDGAGVAGICPHCRIMPVKVLNAANLGSWSSLAQGIIYATDQGADIINLSVGAPTPSQTLAAAVQYALEHDVLLVAAAGNYANDTPFYPAALDGVIGVSATTSTGERWERSNFGPSVDLSAPGELIYSTYHELNNVYGGYTYMSGTSMAAPFVSGLAGLVLSVSPQMSSAAVTEALLGGVDDLGPAGWDADYGYGRINAARTLRTEVLANDVVPNAAVHRIFLPALARN